MKHMIITKLSMNQLLKAGLQSAARVSGRAVQAKLYHQTLNKSDASRIRAYSYAPQAARIACMAYDKSNQIHKKINNLVTSSKSKVFVFMKGLPEEPLCRYSGVVCQILEAYKVDFEGYNVLEDADVRQEIKTYSDWPTIPQVFINGSFVGGCDIMLQMHQSGELKQLLAEVAAAGDGGGGGQ